MNDSEPPMLWCEHCQSYHVTPVSDLHYRLLKCRAPRKLNPNWITVLLWVSFAIGTAGCILQLLINLVK